MRRLGSEMSFVRGCVKKCKEYHNDNEKRTCCYGDFCNNEAPSVWPSPSSSTAPTEISYVPPLLTHATTATPAPPTDSTDSKPATVPELITDTTTVDPRTAPQLKCHCSSCTNSDNTCLAKYACASLVIRSVLMTWCIHDKFSCENDTYKLNCCYKDNCNDPPGPPCDDEDAEQSGCDYGELFFTNTNVLII